MNLKGIGGGLAYLLFTAIAVFVTLELGARLYFATQVGPRVLAYGTGLYRSHTSDAQTPLLSQQFREQKRVNQTVFLHEDARGGYSKFFPHESKRTHDVDTGEVYPVRINGQGFRGRDFAMTKEPGVLRVITLGSSSTFGYYNRDTTTYPYLLEEILNRRLGEGRAEVLNLAIPHLTSGQILALFLAEGLDLDPDVVTFYEGRNDTALVTERRAGPVTASERARLLLRDRILIVAFVDHLVASRRPAPVSAGHDPVLVPARDQYLANVNAIYQACRERGIRFIVANQQASSQPTFGRSEEHRRPLQGISYQDEVDLVQASLDRGAELTGSEYGLLVHDRFMKALEAWASREQVPFVNVIELLDQDRHLLLSWVHLHADANQMIASALADEILN